MKKILILANHFITLRILRIELIERLLSEKFEVCLSIPEDENGFFKNLGCRVIKTEIDRHGMNPIKDFKLVDRYFEIIKFENPDVILSYTIKPNIYGGICSKILNKPFVPNITGFGIGMDKSLLIRAFLTKLYKLAINGQRCVFVQNEENKKFLEDKKINPQKCVLIPGSGVNLTKYKLIEYPQCETVNFFFIARVMKAKGIDEYLEAAEYISKKYENIKFHICGFCEDNYEKTIKEAIEQGLITYHGMCEDINEIHKINSCTIHPSYHEGMSNVILESAACGRPCLCSDISGCREIVKDGVNGYLFMPQNSESLISAIEKFLSLSVEKRQIMGLNGREKIKKVFDRQIVIDTYMKEIYNVLEDKNVQFI